MTERICLTWHTLLLAYWPALVVADFFTTEVWTVRGLVTYYPASVLELHSGRLQVIGYTPHPDEMFVSQACGTRAARRTDCSARG